MDDVVWLTYDEIAERLDIERESARTLVKRKRWGRRQGNDGKVRIGVPVETLHRVEPATVPPTDPVQDPDHVPVQDPDHVPDAVWRELIDGLEARAAELRADLDRERVERVQERDRANALVDRAADLARQLAQAVGEGATRERELLARVAAAETALAVAQARRPWWRRLAAA